MCQAVGQVLLSHNPFEFEGVRLPLLAGTQRFPSKGAGASAAPAAGSSGTVGGGEGPPTHLTPATLLRPAPRPKSKASRLGLGASDRRRPPVGFGAPVPAAAAGTTFVKATTAAGGEGSSTTAAAAAEPGKKSQDAFRAMLLEKKQT
jgi:hypothetical protein